MRPSLNFNIHQKITFFIIYQHFFSSIKKVVIGIGADHVERMENFCVCIMAGGSGERFWPLSRKRKPKHLLKLLSNCTLIEETVRRVVRVTSSERVWVLTNQDQLEATRGCTAGLLPADHVVAEPARRDTAPACALATAIVARNFPDAVLAMLPADHIIKDAETFGLQLKEAAEVAHRTGAFVTFSIKPTYPATGFGYLALGERIEQTPGRSRFVRVDRFVEKPDEARAREYVASGHFGWNGGMFLWSVDAFQREARRLVPALAAFVEGFATGKPHFLTEEFPKLPKISVDYALMEKASMVVATLAEFDWDDVGAWTALPLHLGTDETGNTTRGSVIAHEAANNIVVAERRLVALCGVQDLIIVETEDAILVCHRDQAQNLKKLHPALPAEVL